MADKVSIYDIARMAGVSATTVYKVVHGKKGVGDQMRRKILAIIKSNGYKSNIVAQTLARKTIKIGIVIEHYTSEFSGEVYTGIKDKFRELADFNIEPIFNSMVGSFSKERILGELSQMLVDGASGVILVPYVPYEEYHEIIGQLTGNNVPVIVATNDIHGSSRLAVVSHDYRLVGELGAELIEIFSPGGSYALFIGNKDVIGHQNLIGGFTERLARSGSKPIAVFETQDDETVSYHLAEKLLRDHPDVNGIFIGTSHSLGVCQRIMEAGRIGDIALVCVDTYKELIDLLQKGIIKATIFQNPYLQGKLAVEKMVDYLLTYQKPGDSILINPRIVLQSNSADYMDEKKETI